MEPASSPLEKKRFFNFDIGHIMFLVVILIVVIAAAGAIVYSSKRYVALGQDYQENTRALEAKTTEAADLQQRLDDREAQLKQLKNEDRAGSAADLLVRQKNKDIENLKKQLQETQLELSSLQNYSRCDELLQEFKGEYNDAVDELFQKTKDVCAELYFGGTTYDNRKQFKSLIDAEVDVETYKAGYTNLTT
ncbi:MAG: hypothetical protein Q7R76_01625 [Candidatus Woesearchaeota archaeon]|nr:hypothetical protein [Candidatus Woesearchaeota archaeon]